MLDPRRSIALLDSANADDKPVSGGVGAVLQRSQFNRFSIPGATLCGRSRQEVLEAQVARLIAEGQS